MAPRIDKDERKQIVALLKEHGGNQGQVAKMCGRSQPAVRRIASEEGIVSINNAPKNANRARKAYAEERRLEIIGKGFDKADALLSGISDAGEFQKWTVGFGTLVDKARLETGEVTSRDEHHHREGSDELEEYFAELDAFRTRDGEADSEESMGPPKADR